MANDSDNQTYVTKPIKTGYLKLKTGYLKLWWASKLVILIDVPGGSCILRKGNIFAWDPLRPHPMCLFIWLVPICTLYDKNIILCIMLSWSPWVILANYRTWGGSRKPQICSQLVRSLSGLRTLELAADGWNEECLAEHCALNLWNLTQGHIVSELHGKYTHRKLEYRKKMLREGCIRRRTEEHKKKHMTQPFLQG